MNNNKLCVCGRPSEKLHCPECGGTKIYTKAKQSVPRIIDGEIISFKMHRCEKCGYFDGYRAKYECKAPIKRTMIEKQDEDRKNLVHKCLNFIPMDTYEKKRFKEYTTCTPQQFQNQIADTFGVRSIGDLTTEQKASIGIDQIVLVSKAVKEQEKNKEDFKKLQPEHMGFRRFSRRDKWRVEGAVPQNILSVNNGDNNTEQKMARSAHSTDPVVLPVGSVDSVVGNNNNNKQQTEAFTGNLTDDDLQALGAKRIED